MKQVKITNVSEIKVGHIYRCYDAYMSLIIEVIAEEITPAGELYGATSVCVNDYRFDVKEHDIVEYVFSSESEKSQWVKEYNESVQRQHEMLYNQ